jgi:hypothetical protein
VSSSVSDRDADHRALSRKSASGVCGNEFSGYAGIGIAMPTRIESTVTVTIRQSDSEASASEAATASINRVEATGAERPLKPVAPVHRVMA